MKYNRKVKYTNRVIRDSLFELLRKKKIEAITVKELCSLADINRSTFYNHYRDIFELVEKLEDEIVHDIMQDISVENISKVNQEQFFKTIFGKILKSEEKYRLLFLNKESIRAIDNMFDRIFKYSNQILKDEDNELTENIIKHVYAFTSRGCAQLVISWFENGMIESPDEMSKLMSDLLNGKYNYWQINISNKYFTSLNLNIFRRMD